MFRRISDPPKQETVCNNKTMPAQEAPGKNSTVDGLRDMQGLAARFFGGRSAAEPGVARSKVHG